MSNINEFLMTTGRTLAQMALYTVDHPSVKESVKESYEQLSRVLMETPEIALSTSENKLIVNGRAQDHMPDVAVRPFIQLLANFDLHSLSFHPGLTIQELIPFFQLASRGESKKLGSSVAEYFNTHNVVHIKVNQAKYAKIGEDEVVGGVGAHQDILAAISTADSDKQFVSQLEGLRLDTLLRKLIEKSVSNESDRLKVLNLVTKHIKLEIEDAVNKATASLKKENIKVSNERDRGESVAESVADGVVVVDETGNVIMMNPAAESIYGVKLSDCLGKPLWQGVREEQMVALAKDLTVPTDRPLIKEVQLNASAETQRTLRASTATVQDTSGHVVGMVSVLSDVTKQKELTRLQNEFMANVTHDLRTPIHALKLAVSAILEGAAGPVSPEQNKMLSLANRNVERLSRLIDDLLDFSQVESGTLKVNLQVVELEPLLKEAIMGLDAWTKNRGVTLSLQADKNTPTVYADSDRILQVVINLISNSVKFTPAGGQITVRTRVIHEHAKAMVQVDVEDTGKGIPPDDQKRIFDRFVQLVNSEKLDVRGTGLGLSICKALIELHKGSMSVISPPPGKSTGSLFSFTLPSIQKTAPIHKLSDSDPFVPVQAVSAPTKKQGFWKRLFSRSSVIFLFMTCALVSHAARPYQGQVRRVINPDLIQLSDGTRIRLAGIQVVEAGHALYPEASSASRQWIQGKEITLDYGPDERGRDGVWQAYVYADGVFINEELIRSGLALVAKLQNDERIGRQLVAAERDARRKKRGLWADLRLESPKQSEPGSSTPPWVSEEEIKSGVKQ